MITVNVDYPTMETGESDVYITRRPTGEKFLRVELTHPILPEHEAAFKTIADAVVEVMRELGEAAR